MELLLDSIIEDSHQGRCNALIDTGALITGLTNQEVGGHGSMKGGEKECVNITVKDEGFTDIRCKGLSPMSWLSFFSSVVRLQTVRFPTRFLMNFAYFAGTLSTNVVLNQVGLQRY